MSEASLSCEMIENSPSHQTSPTDCRHDWTIDQITALFAMNFNDLIFKAASLHRQYFDPNLIQVSQLLSIKTGKCSEDCGYCPQSAHFDTGLKSEPLLSLEKVLKAAKEAKDSGSTRFCMGAAWRGPGRDIDKVCAMIAAVKKLGLETCASLGLLEEEQAQKLRDSGLDYYNHNIDTSPEFYQEIITTRHFKDRIETLEHVREAGIKVCSGGIVGMGETRHDRARMLQELATMAEHPESVPLNILIPIQGTPLEHHEKVDPLEFVRTIAVARILMPKAYVRIAAGRQTMTDELHALCFFAGANSLFAGDKLLTAENSAPDRDRLLFEKLGLEIEQG
jgi:biotin synthase